MPVPAKIRALNLAIPARPRAIAEMTRLLASPHHQTSEVGAVIESDMGLAAAVLQVVNSSLFGLAGKVQTVLEAITFLGMREVSALTLQMGLRAAFAASPAMDALWERAALRGQRMARLAAALEVDPWVAHSAGLFEECGKAVLLRHSPDLYRILMTTADDEAALLVLEYAAFGVCHDTLGAAMCETWGLAAAAVAAVRHLARARSTGQLPHAQDGRAICALALLAPLLDADPRHWAEAVAAIGDQMSWSAATMLQALDTARRAEPADAVCP